VPPDGDLENVAGITPYVSEYHFAEPLAVLTKPSVLLLGRYASQKLPAASVGCVVVAAVFQPATGVNSAVSASFVPGPPPGPEAS
jgi:hypothetical protein